MISASKRPDSPHLLTPIAALSQHVFSVFLLLSLLFMSQVRGRTFSSDDYRAFSLRLQPLRNLPSSHAAIQESQAGDLTAHEWGTFTSIAGPDGRAMDWLPLTGTTDLPSFVEHFRDVNFKGGLRGTVRMETPVLYFYSSRETSVAVDVSFSRGLITEWYPHADSINSSLNPRLLSLYAQKAPGSISWNSVHIDPHAAADFPSGNSDNPYYAARQTSSCPLELSTANGPQHEKFLFYRGVAALPPPLSATISSDGTVFLQNDLPADGIPRGSELHLQHLASATTGLQPLRNPLPNSSPDIPPSSGENTSNEIPKVILFERSGTKFGYRILGPLRDLASLSQPSLDGSLDSLSSALEGFLISQGLFPDEAHAMIETWKSSWFEEGSRLIYIVPRPFVDSVLPLHVNPAPANTVRVYVGRLELITPATQQAVQSAFGSNDRATLAKYSRFLEPILVSMLQGTTDSARSQRLQSYLQTINEILQEGSSANRDGTRP